MGGTGAGYEDVKSVAGARALVDGGPAVDEDVAARGCWLCVVNTGINRTCCSGAFCLSFLLNARRIPFFIDFLRCTGAPMGIVVGRVVF